MRRSLAGRPGSRCPGRLAAQQPLNTRSIAACFPPTPPAVIDQQTTRVQRLATANGTFQSKFITSAYSASLTFAQDDSLFITL